MNLKYCPRKKYPSDSPEKRKEYRKTITIPWLITFRNIENRCRWKTGLYFKKGIKLLITKEQLKELWFRDKGYKMKKPSIDRINPKGHYEINNCRYIERNLNVKEAVVRRWAEYKKMKISTIDSAPEVKE